jgi:hypothetical protein
MAGMSDVSGVFFSTNSVCKTPHSWHQHIRNVQIGQQAPGYFDGGCARGYQDNRIFGFEVSGEKFSRGLIVIYDHDQRLFAFRLGRHPLKV